MATVTPNTSNAQLLEALMQMLAAKSTQIEDNLLSLMSALNEVLSETSGDTNITSIGVHTSVWQTIAALVPRIESRLQRLSETMAEKQSLSEEWKRCVRREKQLQRKIEVMRRLYHDVKDELEWRQTCDEVLGDGEADDRPKRVESSPDANRSMRYLTATLALIWSSTQSPKTIDTFCESGEELRRFVETLLEILESFVAKERPLDVETIESICGICVNVFSHKVVQNDEFVVRDWNRWISCLSSVDNHYSLMALFNISFNARGLEAMSARNGFVTQMARNVLRCDLQLDSKLKCTSLQLIHNLIIQTADMNARLKMYAELTQVMPIVRIQHMICHEPNPGLREDCAKLLASIGHLAHRSLKVATYPLDTPLH
jgi:hypothetical protein